MTVQTKNHLAVLIFCLFLTIMLSKVLTAVPPDMKKARETYQITRAESKIKIDGVLDEGAWKNALLIPLNYEISPGENVEPPVKTECLVSYDTSNLYVAFRAFDPKRSSIRAHYSDRDNLWQDDKVGVMLDTFNDENRAFFFVVNPLGIQRDLIVSSGGSQWDDSWDAIWDSSGRITDFGYVVEIAIPFRSLQFQRKSENIEQTWGIELMRIYPRNLYHTIKNYPDDRNEECRICKFPKITGFKGIKPGKRMELDPTLTGVKSDERQDFPGGPFKQVNAEIDAGLSGHWGITPNLTLSGALNPDFSQVEADAAQLDINTQFALYYAEKRPFFLEGTDFFKTPLNAVYTRTLADPDWGVKLSGKEGKNTIGFFTVRDRITNLVFPGTEGSRSTSLYRKSLSTVLRYRRDIGSSSTLGLLIADREGKHYHNRLVGIDGLIRITKSDIVTFQFLGSNTLYPTEIAESFDQNKDDFYGTALHLSYQRKKRSFNLAAAYNDYSPGFRADLGYMPQVDFRNLEIGGGYTIWGKGGSLFPKIEINGNFYQTEDHDRGLVERNAAILVLLEGPMQSVLEWQLGTGKRVFNDSHFNQTTASLWFNATPSRNFHFSFLLACGDDIDYAHTRAAKKLLFNPNIGYNFGKHLSVSLGYLINRLNVEGGRLFSAHLTELRLLYHFNKRMFFRGIFQYTHIERNPQLYDFEVDPKYKKLFSQFLFSYKLNPRTVLFLGYTDDYYGYEIIPLTQSNRTLFIKIGYALSL